MFFLSACANSTKAPSKVKTELYFGLSKENVQIPEATWDTFKLDIIENILDGYTELKAKGYWKSPDGTKYYENSRVIVYIHDNSPAEQIKLDSIVKLYKDEFDQESVLVTEQEIDFEFQ